MSLKSIMRLSCSEAANICDKTAYRESGFLERLKLRIHLYFCRNCQKYNKKNKRLNELLTQARMHSCSREEKEIFKERIQKNLSNHPEKK